MPDLPYYVLVVSGPQVVGQIAMSELTLVVSAITLFSLKQDLTGWSVGRVTANVWRGSDLFLCHG